MKHIGEFMPDFRTIDSNKNYDEEECKVCGAIVKFSENEYKKACKNCGTWVFQMLKAKKIRERRIACFICMDKGIVQYPVQKDGNLYNHIARCNCPNSMKWPTTIPLLVKCQYAPKPEFKEKKTERLNLNHVCSFR